MDARDTADIGNGNPKVLVTCPNNARPTASQR
jgi:hypothetical protein